MIHFVKGKIIRKKASDQNWEGYLKVEGSPKINHLELISICTDLFKQKPKVNKKHIGYSELMKTIYNDRIDQIDSYYRSI